MSSLFKNLIIVLIIVVLLGVVYMVTIGAPDEVTSVGIGSTGSAEIRIQNEKILADTQEIRNYTMDVSIFSDRRFLSLRNYQVVIEDVNTGRSNPFAPRN